MKNDRFALTRKIAVIGIVTNIILLILKLTVGFLSRSQAMIADGFNSAGDVFASIATYTGNKISSKPDDETHPYGHGKAEYIFSMIISFSLFLVAYKIFRSSVNSIMKGETFTFSYWLIIIAVSTIILKSVLFVYTRRAGRKEDNLLIIANSEDHRNDVFVTSSTLLGIVFGYYGIGWLDGVVGIGIALWIAYTGAKIFIHSYSVLMDTNMDKKLASDVKRTIENIEGVDHVDTVTAKPVGISFILIVKVSVNGNLKIYEGHKIAGKIRETLRSLQGVRDVVVHVNPA